MTAGHIYTVAGNGTDTFSGDGGPAIKAAPNAPYSVAVDDAGKLAAADRNNHRIRAVAAPSGTFYGKAMTRAHLHRGRERYDRIRRRRRPGHSRRGR
jgi:hypothetical protein